MFVSCRSPPNFWTDRSFTANVIYAIATENYSTRPGFSQPHNSKRPRFSENADRVIHDAHDRWRRWQRPSAVVSKKARLAATICVYAIFTLFHFKLTMFLRLSQIYLIANGDINSINVREGEKVLTYGQIVTVGCTKSTNVEKQICGLILQTSAMSSFPHTINGFFKIESEKPEIEKMQCSCKAGLSGSGKHVVAALLFMERYEMFRILYFLFSHFFRKTSL